MSVYVVVQIKINDRELYDRYTANFWDVFKKYQGKLLSNDENPEVLEGEWPKDKIVLMQFPDKSAFLDWATSPEYLQIAKDRLAGAEAVILLSQDLS